MGYLNCYKLSIYSLVIKEDNSAGAVINPASAVGILKLPSQAGFIYYCVCGILTLYVLNTVLLILPVYVVAIFIAIDSYGVVGPYYLSNLLVA